MMQVVHANFRTLFISSWFVLIHLKNYECHGFSPKYSPAKRTTGTGTSFYNKKIMVPPKALAKAVDASLFPLQLSSSPNAEENDGDNNFNITQLTDRIQKIKDYESETSEFFFRGLHQRVQELQSAEIVEEQLNSENGGEGTNRVSLPVISFDALLPNQKLEGSTQDPTFIQLLMDVGLGGWFVMTSLDFRLRKIRRNGVLCKVEFLDAAKKKFKSDENRNNPLRIPTSVNFVIVGKRRCRVFGKSKSLKTRIGRWRRSYDENGEDILLGWGEERFIDLAENTYNAANDEAEVDINSSGEEPVKDYRKWSMTMVETSFDQNEVITPEMIDKATSLIPMLDEWYELASDTKTYYNTNVTATARVWNQPILSIEPEKLLLSVMKDLGERPSPDDLTAFAFWAAAFINPLPALGVSLEIRGKILEAVGVEERLKVLEVGLLRSIQNLKGERPL